MCCLRVKKTRIFELHGIPYPSISYHFIGQTDVVDCSLCLLIQQMLNYDCVKMRKNFDWQQRESDEE